MLNFGLFGKLLFHQQGKTQVISNQLNSPFPSMSAAGLFGPNLVLSNIAAGKLFCLNAMA